jgi:DNA-binding NarL/FixJ family response regulator
MLLRLRLLLDWSMLAMILSARNRSVFEVAGLFDPADPGVVEQARRLQPDAVILGFSAGGVKPALIAALRKACPAVALVVWACLENPGDAAAAIEAGADGYLVQKDLSPSELLQAVHLICQTGLSFFPGSACSFF